MSDGTRWLGGDWVRWGVKRAKVTFTVWTYAVLAPVGFVGFGILSFLWRRDPRRRALRLQRITVFAYRRMHAWLSLLGLARFDHRRRLEGVPDGPCVVVANHPCLMDITATLAVLGEACTIVKPALYRRRMLRLLLEPAGNLEGPGSDPMSVERVVQQAVGMLEQGFRLVVFPEGTRSREGKLLAFGRAPFEIACRANVPLVSLSIECEPPWLTKEVPLYSPPQVTPELSVELFAIDRPDDVERESKRLKRRVEERFRAWWEGRRAANRVYDPAPKETRCRIISKTS